jgi:hypothetical protein
MVKRRVKGRATPPRAENGRTVSEEITLLVNTLRELAAIRSTAEDAAGRIFSPPPKDCLPSPIRKSEEGRGSDPRDHDACGFHDLVGQRVTKITESLDRVLAKRMKGAGKSKSKLKLEGPGLGEASQASIDALFSEN